MFLKKEKSHKGLDLESMVGLARWIPSLTLEIALFMLFLSCLLCFHARLFVDALWSPAGKGLTSWLLFVMSTCDVVTFPMVPRVRCGACLYRFLITALFLSFRNPNAHGRV